MPLKPSSASEQLWDSGLEAYPLSTSGFLAKRVIRSRCSGASRTPDSVAGIQVSGAVVITRSGGTLGGSDRLAF